MTTLHYDAHSLRLNFSSTANFRREIAVRFPRNSRNLGAVSLLANLSGAVDAVETPLLDIYGELFDYVQDGEAHAGLLRQIGFHSWPSSATEFVQGYIAGRTAR